MKQTRLLFCTEEIHSASPKRPVGCITTDRAAGVPNNCVWVNKQNFFIFHLDS
jgi:hypothetical protein